MKSTLTVLGLVISHFSIAQSGTVYDELSMNSKILEMDRKYAVYLPPDYSTSSRSYPILYLLHGGGGDHTEWVQLGEVLHIADKAINDGIATSMVIIMPDAYSVQRGYFNYITGKWRYEDFLLRSLFHLWKKQYRIKSEKRYRAVAGLFMGGGGSFIYALHRPDLFSSACPLSASCGPIKVEETRAWVTRRQGEGEYKDTDLKSYYDRYSVVDLVQKMPVDEVKAVRWFIDCGDDDFLYEGNSLVHIAMRKEDIPHEFRIRDGAHTWTYWRESLSKVLSFVSDDFHRR